MRLTDGRRRVSQTLPSGVAVDRGYDRPTHRQDAIALYEGRGADVDGIADGQEGLGIGARLLDPTRAYEQEADRMHRAGPRKRSVLP